MKKFALVFSGCGVYDGSEIHEATLSMLAIVKHDASYQVFAPDVAQYHVINHLNGVEMSETRNVLVESARIARGSIIDLDSFKAKDFDGLLFPGGFGAAKNLSSWAFEGAGSTVLPGVEKAIKDMVEMGKPVGALCISPVILAKVLGAVHLTIGNDRGTADEMEELGATHVDADHGEVVVDAKHKVVSTPCYMLDATIVQIAEGADKVVKTMLDMME